MNPNDDLVLDLDDALTTLEQIDGMLDPDRTRDGVKTFNPAMARVLARGSLKRIKGDPNEPR